MKTTTAAARSPSPTPSLASNRALLSGAECACASAARLEEQARAFASGVRVYIYLYTYTSSTRCLLSTAAETHDLEKNGGTLYFFAFFFFSRACLFKFDEAFASFSPTPSHERRPQLLVLERPFVWFWGPRVPHRTRTEIDIKVRRRLLREVMREDVRSALNRFAAGLDVCELVRPSEA